ncbi:MAG: aminotransferase class V-fold PLP-dependent enzyme, partial [Myxococcota bacterium]|nr:aminotransferase class V-fold PLP-dependent enzyme [Myxococcota bacterium]
ARLARQLGGSPEEVIFTGGGTEANGLACLGLAGDRPARIAISAVEHASIAHAAAWLAEHKGWQVDLIPTDGEGRIQPESVANVVGPETRIVAIMLANNELGTVNDIRSIVQRVGLHAPRARVVVDAIQAFAKMPFSVRRLGADCVSIAAHKLHGPNGIGALWTRKALRPVFRGGGQEMGIRGGTLSAPLAWAFAEAAERQAVAMPSIEEMRNRLWTLIQNRIEGVSLNGPTPGPTRLKNNLNICIAGLPSEPLVNALSSTDVCVSSGSACGKGKFSKTLAAIGRKDRDGAFLRLSPGRFNSNAQMDVVVERLTKAVQELRAVY